MYLCDNCGKRYERDDELTIFFPNIPNLHKRISPGDIVPAGECPECGALVYPEGMGVRLLVLLDGGLVQDVLADRPTVEVAVLNLDLEGADEDDIVDVVDEIDTLRGTMQAYDVTVAPALIESAWRPIE